jgi:hypothetical protein
MVPFPADELYFLFTTKSIPSLGATQLSIKFKTKAVFGGGGGIKRQWCEAGHVTPSSDIFSLLLKLFTVVIYSSILFT